MASSSSPSPSSAATPSGTHPHGDPDAQRSREKCLQILAISPKVRYAGIMNAFGRTVAGALRKGVAPLLKPEEAKSEYFIEASRTQMRRQFEQSIGKTEYTLTENEKVKILSVPGNKDSRFFAYVTMDKDTPPSEVAKIIESVRKMV
jgi:hypothetical protein